MPGCLHNQAKDLAPPFECEFVTCWKFLKIFWLLPRPSESEAAEAPIVIGLIGKQAASVILINCRIRFDACRTRPGIGGSRKKVAPFMPQSQMRSRSPFQSEGFYPRLTRSSG